MNKMAKKEKNEIIARQKERKKEEVEPKVKEKR